MEDNDIFNNINERKNQYMEKFEGLRNTVQQYIFTEEILGNKVLSIKTNKSDATPGYVTNLGVYQHINNLSEFKKNPSCNTLSELNASKKMRYNNQPDVPGFASADSFTDSNGNVLKDFKLQIGDERNPNTPCGNSGKNVYVVPEV